MNLNDELKALARYRFEQSKECINSAKVLRDCGDYKGAANRSYYAFFTRCGVCLRYTIVIMMIFTLFQNQM